MLSGEITEKKYLRKNSWLQSKIILGLQPANLRYYQLFHLFLNAQYAYTKKQNKKPMSH